MAVVIVPVASKEKDALILRASICVALQLYIKEAQ